MIHKQMRMLKKISFICYFFFLFLGNNAFSANVDSLKQAVKSMPDDSLKCATLVNISLILYSGEESEVYAYRALALAKKLGIKRLIGRAYYAITWSHGYDEMDKKTAYWDSTVMIFTETQDADGLGLAYNVNAIMYLNYDEPEEALASLEKAYAYFEQANDKGLQAVILNNIGVCLNELGRPEEAIERFEKALAYHLKEKPIAHIRIGRVYFGLGDASKALGKVDIATDYYLQSYTYRKKAHNQAVAEALKGIALMIFETAEKGQDTLPIIQKIQAIGFATSFALLDSAEAVKGIAERIEFLAAIYDVRRKGHLLYGNYKQAYLLLEEQKRIEEEHKLSASSLEAFADLKNQYEKEQLKTRLLEEEVDNQAKENQVNLLLSSTAILLAILVIGFLVYQNRLKANHLLLTEAKQEQQNVAMRSMLEGQEKERARIARDLHDGLGNLLSTLKVNVEGLQINFKDKEGEEMYAHATKMIDEACTEVRKIAHEMMPEALKRLGLKKALADLAVKMDSTYGFDVDFQVYGKEQLLDDNTSVMLFRMLQELFNNIVKYAGATEVLLQMTFSENWLNLTIEDDGKGFDLENRENESGMGLKSIAFRTHYIGGEYEIDSRPGMGTSVSINVPLYPLQTPLS